MRIEKFWVVTLPSELSELADIVFETEPARLSLSFKGGLDPKEIVAVYAGENAEDEAERHGQELLKRRTEFLAPVECGAKIGKLDRACNRPLGHDGIHYHDLCLKNGRYIDDPAAEGEAAAKAEGVEFVTEKNECPGCSGLGIPFEPEKLAHEGDEVFTCSHCGGIFGEVGDPSNYIEGWPRMAPGHGTPARYFDLTFSAGSERTHGWTDAEGRVVQFG